MLTRYSLVAPVLPPEPPVPVTVPVLKPAQTTVLLIGDAELRVGAVGLVVKVQEEMVDQSESTQP